MQLYDFRVSVKWKVVFLVLLAYKATSSFIMILKNLHATLLMSK